jgi:hypothetical protein
MRRLTVSICFPFASPKADIRQRYPPPECPRMLRSAGDLLEGQANVVRMATRSWPVRARPCRRCCGRPVPFRSYSRRRSIRSAPARNSLAQPDGNATGFLQFEYDLAGKWLELLKEVAPQVRRVGVLRVLETSADAGQWAAIDPVTRGPSTRQS